jgi:hypothetical protein
MLTAIVPKLPMRNKLLTKQFYTTQLGFEVFGSADFDAYLMLQKDGFKIHFFEFTKLNPLENYGQIYLRTNDIESLYISLIDKDTIIHPNGNLQQKPWGQKEFSLLDPDHNLLTFGEYI